MSTYCRITGKSRGLPKPNYFPLLPPISPADAKRLCRITGKSYGLPSHHYIPVLVGFAKPKQKVTCHITTKAEGQEPHHYFPGVKHTLLKGYRYIFPVLETCIELAGILEGKSLNNDDKYVYTVNERRCSLVFPGKLEAAVRDGDVRDIMLAKDMDILLLKLRKGGSIEVDVKEISVHDMELYEGEGPNEEVLSKRKKRKRPDNEWRRKIFEDKERSAEDDEKASDMKSKRIKVKLSTINEPSNSSWNDLNCENTPLNGLVESVVNDVFESVLNKDISELIKSEGEIFVSTLPQPLKLDPIFVDLSTSSPGIIQQPLVPSDNIIGFPVATILQPFRPFIPESDSQADTLICDLNADKEALLDLFRIQSTTLCEYIDILPKIEDTCKIASQLESIIRSTSENVEKIESGVIVTIEDGRYYIPGKFIETTEGEIFVAGNVIETPVGPSFVPGFMISTQEGTKFLPGKILKEKDTGTPLFVAGQTILTREGEKFVQGQYIKTNEGVKFVPGQTILSQGGSKFVPGQITEDKNNNGECKFIVGQTIMTSEGPQFVPGQFTYLANDELAFVSGQSVLDENYKWEFVPGQSIKNDAGEYNFVPGKYVNTSEGQIFIPGRLVTENNQEHFIPGLSVFDEDELKFVPGVQINTSDGAKFVEGMIVKTGSSFHFTPGNVTRLEVDSNASIQFTAAKTAEEVQLHDSSSNFGISIKSTFPVETESNEVFGHMVQSSQGVEFFPGDAIGLPAGKMIPGRLIRGKELKFIPGMMIDEKFVPGQIVMTDRGEQFVPGQVLETTEGPKFVPGQVIQTRSGSKFVPGQTVETEDGPKFIPGQIIQTKAGPTFIPGQVISTEEEGSKFVPGQVVDTIEGPRFVPGRVVETGDHVTFIPGQVVETEEGLKFVAPDLEDDPEGGCQFTLQGFEVSQEELKMVQRNSIPYASFIGEPVIDSKMMQQLSNAGMAIGREIPVDMPVVDIRSSPVTETACKVAEKLSIDALYSVKLSHILTNMQMLLLSSTASDETPKDEILNTLLHFVSDCSDGANVLENLGNAIENTINTKLDHKLDVIDRLHSLTTELAIKLRSKPDKVFILRSMMTSNCLDSSDDKMKKILSILNDEDAAICVAFQNISKQNPSFVDDVLKNVAKMIHDRADEKEAANILHRAIVKTVTETSEIKVQQAIDNTDSSDFRSLVNDAIGLARALGMTEVVTTLIDVLKDAKSIQILAQDKVTMEVLKRLTIMRQLASEKPLYGGALQELQIDPYSARNNPKLRELVRESAMLMVIPEALVLRSSEDIPASLLFSDNSLAVEDFMAKSRHAGNTFLILKSGIQAVIPRESARAVLTGKVPYTVLDETGIHYFKPLHVLSALKLPKFVSNRFSNYSFASMYFDDDDSTTRGSSASIEDVRKNFQNGCSIGREGMEEEFVLVKDYDGDDDDFYLEKGEKVKVLKTDDDDPTLLMVQVCDEPSRTGLVPMDFLKKVPSSRTQTPDSGLHSQKTRKQEAKFNREVCIGELIETEEEFGRDLQRVVEKYLTPLEEETRPAPRAVMDNKDMIFNNLISISQFHNGVMRSGVKYFLKEPKTIGRTLLRLERDFDKHAEYVKNEPLAQEILETSDEIRDYFDDLSQEIGDDKVLADHLKLPIQRINDYTLLLQELIKYSKILGEDITDLERALELMLWIPTRCNDLRFITNIEGFHGDIHKLGRLIRHNWFLVKDKSSKKGSERYCFLFKARLLICKVRRISEDRVVFVLKEIIKLPEVNFRNKADKRTFEIHHETPDFGNYPFTFTAHEDDVKGDWLAEIQEHIAELLALAEHAADDLKLQTHPEEDPFEPLKGVELDISPDIEEGLGPIEREGHKKLKHVPEPKRPPLEIPKKRTPIFTCVDPSPSPEREPTPPPEPEPEPEPEMFSSYRYEEYSVKEEVYMETTVEEPAVEEDEVEELIEITGKPKPRYIPGVSKPLFHSTIRGSSNERTEDFDEEYNWWKHTTVSSDFLRKRYESSVKAGENAVYECEVEGATDVTWLKDNRPLSDRMADRITISNEGNIYRLEIKNVCESDSGTYTARAENDLGVSYSTAHLIVEKFTDEEKKARAKSTSPVFLVQLKDAELLESTHARFAVKVNGNPMPEVTFYKGDKQITEDDENVQIIKDPANPGYYELVIPDVKPEDAGEYRCVAANKYSDESCSCFVTVTNEKDVFAGLEDYLDGGVPKFIWLKNGKPFTPEERFKVIYKDEEDSLALIFQNVRPEDAGLYTCVASTSHGKISCSAELTIQGTIKEIQKLPRKAKIETITKTYEGTCGSTVVLEAVAVGDPFPTVRWFKNDEEITATGRYKLLYEEETETASLVIKNVNLEDSGEYKICARNELGTDVQSVTLQVKAPPKITKKLEDFTGLTGKELRLTIQVEASPKPIVQWYKDGMMIKKSNRFKYENDEASDTYTLVIENAVMEDAGTYSVVASNEFCQISDVCHLSMESPPQFVGSLTKELETLEGDYVSFSVIVEGDPLPQVKWKFNGTELVHDGVHYKMSSNEGVFTLLINEVKREYAGTYTCEISNQWGSNECEGYLYVKCLPRFDAELRDTNINEGVDTEFTVKVNAFPKATVKWFYGDAEITQKKKSYIIQEDGDTYTLVVKEPTTKLSGVYTCKAENEVGVKETSCSLSVHTKPTFNKELENVDINEGDTLKLTVQCKGVPEPEVKWYRNGEELYSDSRIKITRDAKRIENYNLTITLVKSEDGGEYEVRATNEIGTAVTKSLVTVLASTSHKKRNKDNKMHDDVVNGDLEINGETERSDHDQDAQVKSEVTIKLPAKQKLNTVDLNKKPSINSCPMKKMLSMDSGDEEHSFSVRELRSEEFTSAAELKPSSFGLVEEPPENEHYIKINISRGVSIVSVSEDENLESEKKTYEFSEEDEINIDIKGNEVPKVNGEQSLIKRQMSDINRTLSSVDSENIIGYSSSRQSSVIEQVKSSKADALERQQSRILDGRKSSLKSYDSVSDDKKPQKAVSFDEHSKILEDDNDESMNDLLKRVQKQRSILGEILEKQQDVKPIETLERQLSKQKSVPDDSPIELNERIPESKSLEKQERKLEKQFSRGSIANDGIADKTDVDTSSPKVADVQELNDKPKTSELLEKLEKPERKFDKQLSRGSVLDNENASLSTDGSEITDASDDDKSNLRNKLIREKTSFENEQKPHVASTDEPSASDTVVDGKRSRPLSKANSLSEPSKPQHSELDEKSKKGSSLEAQEQVNKSFDQPDLLQVGKEKSVDSERSETSDNAVKPHHKLERTATDRWSTLESIPGLSADEPKAPQKGQLLEKEDKSTLDLSADEPKTSQKVQLQEKDEAKEYPRVLSGMNEDIDTFETLSASFEVAGFGVPKPTAIWYKDDEELAESKRFIMKEEGDKYKLEVLDLRSADQGTYMVKLVNSIGEATQQARLNVSNVENLRGPKFKKTLNDMTIVKKQKVEMEVIVIADPVPDVKWTVNEKDINADFTVDVKEIDLGLKECTYRMIIPSSELSDSGTYKVKVTNKFESAESSASLTIVMQPEIEVIKDIVVPPTSPCTFEATVKSTPEATVKWFVNGTEINSSAKYKLSSQKVDEYVTVHRVTIDDSALSDQGEYKLEAQNAVGKSSSSATLKLHTEVPSFVKLLGDLTVQENDMLQMKVRVNGLPKPSVKWFKNGNEIESSEHLKVETIEEGQLSTSITIEKFTEDDVAEYKVVATNIVGERETAAKLKMAQIEPSFADNLKRVTEVADGEPLEISTKIIGSPVPTVLWFKDGEEIKPDDNRVKISVSPDGLVKLNIDKVNLTDCGAYKAVATNALGKSIANTAVVVNQAPTVPTFIKKLQSVDAVEGDPIKFEIQVAGFPEPKVKWLKDGHPLHLCPKIDLVCFPNSVYGLTIVRGSLEDAGHYSVVVSNKCGECTGNAVARITPADKEPSFQTQMQPTKVVEGFPAKLEVKVVGFPTPKLTWKFNGEPIEIDNEKIKLAETPDGGKCLLIEKVTKDNAGEYELVAENNIGTCSTKAKLSVSSRSNSESEHEKPSFLHGLRDTSLDESGFLSLSAPFIGNPIPDVQWFKDGSLLLPNERIHFTCDGYKVGLEIQDVNMSDMGFYSCALKNPYGEDSTAAHVGVRKLYQAPVFTQRFKHQQQLPGHDAKFHCRVIGVPFPSVVWHRNGLPITNSDKYQIKRDGDVCCLSVFNVNADDDGLYSCIASNRDGTATCEAQLQVVEKIDDTPKQEPPAFMKKIGDCEIYPGMTAKFTACASGYPEPQYEWFLDTIRLHPSDRLVMEKEGSGLVRLKILCANPDQDAGRYRLRAYNAHGEAFCEANINFDNGLETKHRKPVGELYRDFDKFRATGAPLPLPDKPIISRMTDRHLTLSWKPSLPIGPREPVTYLVEMEEQPNGKWFTARAGIRSCACDIHNLKPFADYKFRIRVENNYGISDPSPFAVTYREKLEPDPPKMRSHLPPGIPFHPDTSHYFPKEFDIERPPHDNYAQAPRFLRQEYDTQYGVKDHNVNLFWFVYGYPKPKMTYYFNDELIEMGGRYDSSYTRNGQATLFVNKMLERDVGVYEAVAVNEHGTARQRVQLQIAEYPKFIRRPEETFVPLRKTCRLEARVIGVPYPEIKWYKDWKPLGPSSRIQIDHVEPDLCILRITDVIMKDEGLYSISARNIAGSISTSVYVHIEENNLDLIVGGKKGSVKTRNKKFDDVYDLGDELGRGTQGIVFHAVERNTGKNLAAKVMHGTGDLRKLMTNELDIMNQLNHRNIIRPYDSLISSKAFTIIQELGAGGELLDLLTRKVYITEYEIAFYIRQLLWAIDHMHEFNIGHLGLTPGDLLLSHAGGDHLKLTDFGLSRRINSRKLEPLHFGMPEFVAPEIANGEGVSLSADMWSIGVITHLLLTGISLFRGRDDVDTLTRIKEGNFSISTDISEDARDFIIKLLMMNSNNRLDVRAALNHKWIRMTEHLKPTDGRQINTENLRNYYNLYKDWYSNASCQTWYRRRPLDCCYNEPSRMIYPPGRSYTPAPTPEINFKHDEHHPQTWKDRIPSREPIDSEIGMIKSESHYQYGPDTYLLQLRDVDFPCRLREYMKVARTTSDHIDWQAPVIRERRRFMDVMDEEIDDERKARINQYGSADVYTLRRLKEELGARPTAHVEAEAILGSRIDGLAPFFREKPQIIPVEIDKPAELSCYAVGSPKPLVQWFKNDLVVTEGLRIKLYEDKDGRSILRLDPANEFDLGIYKVVARNKFGQTVARTRLVLASEPGPPDAPEICDFSDTEVLLKWKQPKDDGNTPIQCYGLQMKEEGTEDEWITVAENIDHEAWLVHGLIPNANYQFRLAAMNKIGWGPYGLISKNVQTKFAGAERIMLPNVIRNMQLVCEKGKEIIGDEPKIVPDYSLEYKVLEWVDQPPEEKYRFISEMARGRFSIIVKGIDSTSGKVIVAKLMETNKKTEPEIEREFEILRTMRHERIAYLIEAFKLQYSAVAIFIMEKLQGADILTYLTSRHSYTEQMIATIVTQILDGLQYLHWRGYCHLNLQPDNIVMSTTRSLQIKLIDFSCAQHVGRLGTVIQHKGPLEYTAPEILCDEPAYPYSDIWSVGVLTYILLSGVSPFRGYTELETRQNITFVRYRFEHLYKDLSQESLRFIMLLFKRTPSKRPSAEDCHEHRWLLPTEYMIKKREKTSFDTAKLKVFSDEYHAKRNEVATNSKELLSVIGGRLERSNSIVEELTVGTA